MEPVQQRADRLYAVLEHRAPARAKAWLERAFGGGAAFANELASAARWLGKDAVVLGDEERRELEGAGGSLPPGLSLDELGRIAMLVALSASTPEDGCEAVIDDCYRRGDTGERRAVLRALEQEEKSGTKR